MNNYNKLDDIILNLIFLLYPPNNNNNRGGGDENVGFYLFLFIDVILDEWMFCDFRCFKGSKFYNGVDIWRGRELNIFNT